MLKSKTIWMWLVYFFLGSACFVISQPLLRIPILQYLQQSTDFTLAYTLNPLLVGIFIALSAGVFEEGFRFLFKLFLMKPSACGFSQPIIFGLGHGIAEALIILAPAFAVVPITQLGLAFLERGLAIILHVTLTVIVWNGFQKKRRILFLLIAVAIHGFIDSLIPLFSSLSTSIMWIEGALMGIDVLLIFYAYYSKKYYVQRRNRNEEIKI